MENVLWFSQIGKEDVGKVGGKGANLGEMAGIGLPIPNGFCTTSEAYFKFLKANGIDKAIAKLTENLDVQDTKRLMAVSDEIKALIMSGRIPDDIRSDIIRAYNKLCGAEIPTSSQEVYVAVRSSATAEDLPDASFAGQQATFLNVKGAENVVKAVQKCWASLFESRAIYYRQEKGYSHLKVGLAAVVQEMVQSEKSGVMFTSDPITNDRNKIGIEAAYGLGEIVVSGSITPDRYVVSKDKLEILEKHVAKQTWMITKVDDRNEHVEVKPELQERQKITDDEIIQLAKYGKEIEEHYKWPQDIEWAIAGGEIFIVQSRPITTLKKGGEAVEEGAVSVSSAEIILRGLGASPGVAVGRVKLIPTAKDIGRMEKGEILVTEMTSPDYVPAMKKAAAILTNSGGATCFAGDAKVLTERGFMEMKEVYERVRRGERLHVLSVDENTLKSEWKPAVNAYKRTAPLWRVRISQSGNSKQNTLDVTPDHKMLIFENRKLVERKLCDVLQRGEMICAVDRLPELKTRLHQPSLSYLAGAMFSDGYYNFDARHGRAVFTQKRTPDRAEFIDSVKDSFEDVFGYGFTSEREKFSNGILSRSGEVVVGSATDFVCNRKEPAQKFAQLESELSNWVLSLDEDSLLTFLAGVLDGDGSISADRNRLHIYAGDEKLVQGIVIACLRLGIMPQLSIQRGSCYNIQIVERLRELIEHSKRIKGEAGEKKLGVKLFSAKQLFSDIVDEVNYKGRIKPYVKRNLLLDSRKIERNILPLTDGSLRREIERVVESDLRMLRVEMGEELGENEVYNIEVEDNHNYVVFTKMYTPVLVRNCHAAIVSRELGVPCIVGTKNATEVLKDGDLITVDAKMGVVYRGKVDIAVAKKPEAGEAAVAVSAPVITGTRIYVNLGEPELAEKIAAMNVDGVGLLRAEFMIAGIGVHPRKAIEEHKEQEYVDKLAEGMRRICAAFYPRPVVYRATDFKTNEYRNLQGGEKYEPQEENPMMGYRGCSRYTSEPDVFKLEVDAIKKVREQYGLKNLWLMIPVVRTVEELVEIKKLLEQFGLKRSKDFKLWIMVEVPSTIFLAQEFCDVGIDGISIGSNDLTQFTLACDRDNPTLAAKFDERNEAVLKAIKHVIRVCRKNGVTTSICGQAPSVYPEYAEKLVEFGITSISVNPDMIDVTRRNVASAERKLMLRKLIELTEKDEFEF